ncbi:helix-turn-helix domain-containing protein [Actinopolyspora saharensis]|uniref:Helix-turn-helix domain-containing protein n=1 Tax=Actinopolyspora saharensis TaxID=995062 RepID=A0A1H1H750_9ACTN|nr:helix-turn-helix transcriptional regulator [Actinopolyspora saharensis]SDR21335.1 Helix-turn-helix domain-containing protein [Actinopolyspora saharensis]
MTVSPTVRRRRLAAELRRLRAASEVTQQQAARYLGCTQAKVGRFETAKRSPTVGDVAALLEFYEVDGTTKHRILELARESRKRAWWHSYRDVLTEWYATYVGLESEASSMRTFEPEAVPGLLQTEEYARAITRETLVAASESEISRRAELRMRRQHRITGRDPLELWAVIGEAALHSRVGGTEVLREQLRRLLELARQPHITLQVMPLEARAHPARMGPFVILRYAEEIDPDIVHLETHAGGLSLEEENELSNYDAMMEHLGAHAHEPRKSLDVISARIGEL